MNTTDKPTGMGRVLLGLGAPERGPVLTVIEPERMVEVAHEVSRAMKAKISAGLVLMALLISGQAHAAPAFTEANCIRALMGEASGQSFAEVQAHAFALRNRGTLRGVYGFTAKHVDREPAHVWAKIRKAWLTTYTGAVDPVGGRTEWLSDHDHKLIQKWPPSKRERFMAGLIDPVRVGETTFYRLRRRA